MLKYIDNLYLIIDILHEVTGPDFVWILDDTNWMIDAVNQFYTWDRSLGAVV